ncbi:cytochrome P450 [Flammula alnicola]|nr:cytochrome P450 [Flammula alnicola]
MPDYPPSFVPAVAVALTVGYLVSRWFRSPTYKLKHIPSVGSSGLISSYFEAMRFFRHGREMVQEGYTKYYGTPFKVSMTGRYMVVISGPEMIEDIRRASEEQLSFGEAVAETFQIDYMLGKEIRVDPYHFAIIRSPMTRNLGIRFPEIKDEIITAFSELIPVIDTKEWTSVPAMKTVMQIVCRSSNRLFVGLPLCRNPDYRKIHEQFTLDVFHGAETINMYPTFLRPIVGNLLTKVPMNIKKVVDHIGPIIQERLDKEKQFGPDWQDPSNDLISWLLDVAEGPQRTIHDLAIRILNTNFAAIHTTSNAFTHVLYDLAAYPEYVKPMREEIEAVIEAEGWTKVSMGKMRKVDSFIKESQRLAIAVLSMNRKVLKDFTFSNGVTVPAGTHVAVATYSTHVDETTYTNPDKFEGFRFAEMREAEGEGTKHQMVSLSHDYVTFGTGRHACPGRFFAVNEIKAMLAHVLLTYDVKLPDDGPRPENVWFQAGCSPDPTAQVMFRKRA